MIPSVVEKVTSATLTIEAQSPRRVEINGLISLLIESEWITVLVIDLPVMGYHPEDRQTRNCVAVQLLAAGLVTLSEAVIGFGIPRSTLRDARQRFREQGVRGLIPAKSGPKKAWKLVTRARRLVLDTVYAHPDWKMPQVTDHVNQRLQAEGLAPLSEGHLRRFLTFCGLLPRQGAVEPRVEPSGISVPTDGETRLSEGSDDQAELDEAGQAAPALLSEPACTGPGAGTPGESGGRKLTAARPDLGDSAPYRPDDGSAEPGEPCTAQTVPSPLTAADRCYLARLREGVDTAFGGGFLVVPFLILIQFPLLITRGLAGLPQGYYTTVQMGLTFFYLALFGIPSLEAVKLLVKGEFGVLLGRRRSPGLTKLRSFLKAVERLGRAEALALGAACLQIQAGVVEWQILCIDGHFIPYYGGRCIRKGYFTTRRMALRGNEAYYANDVRGRPLFFLFTQASTSLMAVLPEMVQQVKQIVGDRWVDWCLTLIFDRGGFCAELFKALDVLKVHWITWLKAPREVWEQVDQIEEERFQLYLIRLKSRKVKLKLYEWQVNIAGYGLCRAIILLDLKTGKRMVIITNDQTRSLREIAELMLQRWSQENFFKVMLARYHLDYTPGHRFEPAQAEPLVDNPRLKELRSLKARLQAMKRKLESELAQKLLARKRDQVTLHAYKGAHDKKVRAIKSLEREIEQVKDELAQTPSQVPFSEAVGQPLEVSDLERKHFFDVLKGLAFNAEEWLLERLTPYYHGKDVRQALLQILFRGAVVQLVDGVLHVRLKPFDSPKVQAAAAGLCQELNSLEAFTLDKFRFPIVYEVLPP
ncbi:MAG: putative transposase [Anaerolineae bacterium]